MNYNQSIEKIHSLLRFGSQPGLERINRFLDKMDRPQDKLKFVHIAGTNGKGSVCAFISKVLSEAGYKTGLFISPYIIDFRERMQVDGKMINKDTLAKIVTDLIPLLDEMEQEGSFVTEFEFVMAVSFEYFYRQKCDVVVLETGLGGTHDCTNVIKPPLLSIITSISLDHTDILGTTLKEIALQKCGIIKKDSAVVFKPQEAEVNDVVQMCAKKENSSLKNVNDIVLSNIEFSESKTFATYKDNVLEISMIGHHQIKNLKTALSAIEVLNSRHQMNISMDHIKLGVKKAFLPARMEIMQTKPLVILDGAHNPGGMLALSNAVRDYLPNKKAVAIMGMLSDKDSKHSLEYIKGQFSAIFTLTPDNPRALNAAKLAERAKDMAELVLPMDNEKEAIAMAIEYAGNNGAVVIFGSLYLAAQIRPLFKPKKKIETDQ